MALRLACCGAASSALLVLAGRAELVPARPPDWHWRVTAPLYRHRTAPYLFGSSGRQMLRDLSISVRLAPGAPADCIDAGWNGSGSSFDGLITIGNVFGAVVDGGRKAWADPRLANAAWFGRSRWLAHSSVREDSYSGYAPHRSSHYHA